MSIDDDTLRTFAEECVARGASLLDAERPGWWQRIDITRLHMGTCDRCVLGQEYDGQTTFGTPVPGFYAGIQQLAPKDEQNTVSWAVDFGFDTDRDDEFEVLTQAWLDAINERRWAARPGALQAVSS